LPQRIARDRGAVVGRLFVGAVIAENTLDYNTAVETVTNSVLVSNILRARDGAPLYFSDLSQIRGAVGLSLQTQTTVPYGPVFPGAIGASAQGGPLAVSSQPGFDVAPLNTKKFAEGMLEGIDVKVFAYFFQRHVDPKVFLNLVVSRVELYRKSEKNLVGTCTTDIGKTGTSCVGELISSWTANRAFAPKMGELSEKSEVGPPMPADLFEKQNNIVASLVQSDAANSDVKKSGGDYQLWKPSVKYVLCVAAEPTPRIHSRRPRLTGRHQRSDQAAGADEKQQLRRIAARLSICDLYPVGRGGLLLSWQLAAHRAASDTFRYLRSSD
jgi:hypothetical protein